LSKKVFDLKKGFILGLLARAWALTCAFLFKNTGGSGFHKKKLSISAFNFRILGKNTGGSGFHSFFWAKYRPKTQIWLP